MAAISSAISLLTPWMKKHQIQVGDVPAAKNVVSYLDKFAKDS